jgi:cytochrome c-type biogenesis protein CcmH/NrfF
MRDDLRAEIDAGKNHDQIVTDLIGHYGGQQFLTAPVDKGFNRLAWLFPYLIGVGGIVGVGFVALRWSKRPADGEPTEVAPSNDTALNERLDDELRNLD